MSAEGRSGVLAVGNWIADRLKLIDRWPQQDSLCRVLDSSIANGGCAYNVLKDLAALGADFPLEGAGVLGGDEAGGFILEDCKKSGISTEFMKTDASARTSSTDVMTESPTGRRTFFYDDGASASLDFDGFEIEKSNAKILLCGYVGLLPKMDAERGYEKFLRRAKKCGFDTAVDFVSVKADLRGILGGALQYVDYLSLNELEAAMLLGERVEGDDAKCEKFLTAAAREFFKRGVGKFVIIHFKEGAYGFAKEGEMFWQPAANVSQEKVRGTNGCGDAFLAGFLKCAHDGGGYAAAMRLACAAAASCLTHESASGGILNADECLKLLDK